jgi:hypothetical protein
MRNVRAGIALLTLLALGVPAVAGAQGDSGRHGRQGGGVMRARQGRGALNGPERMRLQRQIRQAFTRAVRDQVGLSNDQMRQLAPINRKYVAQRQELALEERATTIALREQLLAAKPDQDSVAKLSDRLQGFKQRQLDVNAAEAQELGQIMTPVQLARYRALQARVQRQLDMMRPQLGGERAPLPIPDSARSPAGSGGGGGGGGGPPH